MPNGQSAASWRPCGAKQRRLWLRTIGLSIAGLSLSLSACQTSPKPCDCGEAENELRDFTQQYHYALEDIGNLQQQLKACQERP